MCPPLSKMTFAAVIITSITTGCDRTPRTVDQAIAQLQEKNERHRETGATMLGVWGRFTEQPAEQQRAVAALRAALKDTSPRVRSAAASSLGDIGYPAKEAVPDLMKLLRESDDVVRTNAPAAIYVIAREAEGKSVPGAPEAVKELLKALADSDGTVRTHSVGGLVALAPNDEEVMRRVVTMLKDPDMNVRMQTLESLAKLGAKAKKYESQIRRLLHDPENGVQEQAKRTLRTIDEK